MKIKSSFVVLTAVVAAALVVAGSLRRVPQLPLFCDECVMEREVVDWRLGQWKLFETTRIRATAVSDLLNQHHACPPHNHHWSAPQFVADSDLETSEAPRVRSLGFLNTSRAASFLRSLFDYTDPRDIACWREVAWQPAFASALDPALRFARFPENGFTTRAEFLAWWQQNAYPLFNHLNEMTVAD